MALPHRAAKCKGRLVLKVMREITVANGKDLLAFERLYVTDRRGNMRQNVVSYVKTFNVDQGMTLTLESLERMK